MNKNSKNRGRITALSIVCWLPLCGAGCGTTANLAGLGVSLNVAQKGQVAAVSFVAGTNSVTVGGSYSQGTNNIGGVVTVPTN